LDRQSPEDILKLADTVAAHELSSPELIALQDCLGFLLRIGAISQAEDMVGKAPSWKFAGEIASNAEAVRLEFARQVRIAKAINPVHEALAAAALGQFSQVPDALPLEYTNLRIESVLPARNPESTFKACLKLIATRRFERNDFQFWNTFLQAIPEGGGARAAESLLRAGLDSAGDDDIRSQLIVLFFTSLNVDDDAVRRAMEAEFQRYRQPETSPLSYMVIRFYEIHRDLRMGKPTSLETAFLDLKDPRAVIVRQRACLRHYTQTGERDALKRTLDQIDAGQLLSPGFLAQAVPALELLGIVPELKDAREAAARLLRQDVLDSWARGNEPSGEAAIDLALVLGDKGELPDAWVTEEESGSGDPLYQGRILLTQAYLADDWTKVASLATALTRSYPSRYSFYWYLGVALHHLGREREAADALDPYIKYAKDEPEYPLAIKLARTLPGMNPPGT
jgi:hypothetical protein